MKNFYFLVFCMFLIQACNNENKKPSGEIETIPGLSAQMQITSGINENNQPENNVDYFPPQLGKAYAFISFDQISNGNHKYVCKILNEENNTSFIADSFNFKVEAGSHQIITWVEFEKLSGPGEYSFNVFLDDKKILKSSFSILNPTQMNSNYPAYWLEDNLFKEYKQESEKLMDYWKVQSISSTKDPIVSVNVMPYKTLLLQYHKMVHENSMK